MFEARIRGFSAMTGTGRVRLETLGPDGERVKAHRRLLAPGGTLARVGSLWVGDPDCWDLVVESGRRYEVRSRPGTAGRIALAVVAPGGHVLAEAVPTPEAPFPTLGFQVPEPAEGEEAAGLVLEVRSADGGGGTYGVRLHRDARPPGNAPARSGAPSGVETGPQDGEPLGFHANPGDLAVLYVPRSHPYASHALQERTPEGNWVRLAVDDVSLGGQRASMRTPEKAALVWFRPFRPGTYRFMESDPSQAVLGIYPAEEVPEAPLLIGTGLDPSIPARGTSTWRAIGVGVCMPGWDYLFVAVGRRRAAVRMRVRDVETDAGATRVRRGSGLTRVAGLGPSLRFRVSKPTLVRLEVKGKGWTGHALLRRAGN